MNNMNPVNRFVLQIMHLAKAEAEQVAFSNCYNECKAEWRAAGYDVSAALAEAISRLEKVELGFRSRSNRQTGQWAAAISDVRQLVHRDHLSQAGSVTASAQSRHSQP